MHKVCFRCHSEIKDNSEYFSFTEYNNGKEVKTDYAHKECWDKFLKQIGNVDEAMSMLRRLKKPLMNMGLLQDEEVVIR